MLPLLHLLPFSSTWQTSWPLICLPSFVLLCSDHILGDLTSGIGFKHPLSLSMQPSPCGWLSTVVIQFGCRCDRTLFFFCPSLSHISPCPPISPGCLLSSIAISLLLLQMWASSLPTNLWVRDNAFVIVDPVLDKIVKLSRLVHDPLCLCLYRNWCVAMCAALATACGDSLFVLAWVAPVAPQKE